MSRQIFLIVNSIVVPQVCQNSARSSINLPSSSTLQCCRFSNNEPKKLMLLVINLGFCCCCYCYCCCTWDPCQTGFEMSTDAAFVRQRFQINSHWRFSQEKPSTCNCSAYSVTSPSAQLIKTCGQTNTFLQTFLPWVTKQVTDFFSNYKPKCKRGVTTIPTAETSGKTYTRDKSIFFLTKR